MAPPWLVRVLLCHDGQEAPVAVKYVFYSLLHLSWIKWTKGQLHIHSINAIFFSEKELGNKKFVPQIHSGEENKGHHDNFQHILVQKHVL